ncbi:hypothetical protein ABL78_2159 [Leptomonas seymouri]|uniref:Transmembrane protein n=1 Tax=Leptomonas seymouri TaxID=5684 RepID=C6K3X0_LEPSE|nr:conserved hypothetical protein [Leptomonas seymouri]KPI88699.1 hypothetical protein ABL78_2159 [Leptomonas seymouri]|eukprot:KPI88699.1 hypothetical protein ABL78_2159 [Leptomonas seymouri]
MDSYNRQVAIIGSAVYGGLLTIGMLLFAFGRNKEPFYAHPSTNVAIFSVFWFAFSPSLLFIGATVPWVCALCGSTAAALTFAVVPGVLFVGIGAYWVFLNDNYEDVYNTFDMPRASPWSRNTVGVRYSPEGVLQRTHNGAEYFASPAALAEMQNREAGGMYPFMYPPSGWANGGGGRGTPAISNVTTAPPFMGCSALAYVPEGAAVAYPAFGPRLPTPPQAYIRSAVTSPNYGRREGVDGEPQYAYSSSPSPIPMQPRSAQEDRDYHAGGYYIA